MSELNNKTFFARRYWAIFIIAIFMVPFVIRGSRMAIEGNNNNVADWLPDEYEESNDLKRFQKNFLGEQFILASWDGCTLGNTGKLKLLSEKLSPQHPDAKPNKYSKFFEDIVTGPAALEQLTQPPLSLSYSAAIKRLEGALVGPLPAKAEDDDARTTCMIVTLSPLGKQDNKMKRKALEALRAAAEESGIPSVGAGRIHLGGPPVDNVTIDIEGEKTLFKLAGLAGLVGLGLSYLCFRSYRLTAMVFMVGVLSAGISLSMVYWFGVAEMIVQHTHIPRLGSVDAILMSMPAVVYVLGLSGAIHIINYYRDARREHGIEGAPESAVRHGWAPCALAALTTAVGLGSLYISEILPIKKFGLFSAIGVVATLALLFTLLPAWLYKFPPKDEPRQAKGSQGSNPLFQWFMDHVAAFIVRRNGLVCVVMSIVMVVFAAGLFKIETQIQLLKLFDSEADIIYDYAWLEENLGNLVPMEVVLQIDPERQRLGDENAEADGKHYRLNMFERMKLVERVQNRLESLDNVGRAISSVTFGPDLSTERSALFDQAYLVNGILEKNSDKLLEGDYYRREEDGSHPDAIQDRDLWRVSARVGALDDTDYGVFVHDIAGVVKPVLDLYHHRDLILQKMHEGGKQLRKSKICVIYDEPASVESTSADKTGPTKAETEKASIAKTGIGSDWRLLRELLRESGARVKGLNLAAMPTGEKSQQAAQQVRAALAKQDCVVVMAPQTQYDVSKLIEGHSLAIQKLPIVEKGAHEKSGLAALYTGVVPLVYKTQQRLLTSLSWSIGTACVLIAIVMMLVLKGFRAGLASMIPNVFPIVLIFGAMGWLEVKIDIGIMMTASVALGVAVDDTIHFLTWFRYGMRRGMDRKASTLLAYERCATAMFQTTLVAGLGLSVFAASSFTPTQQFGVLMVTLLTAALLGDLVFLPAILCGPVGKSFSARLRSSASEVSQSEPAEPETSSSSPPPAGTSQLRKDKPHRSVKT